MRRLGTLLATALLLLACTSEDESPSASLTPTTATETPVVAEASPTETATLTPTVEVMRWPEPPANLPVVELEAHTDAPPEADRVLVSGHDSLRYYLHDYGIAFAGSLLPSFEDNAEPSAAEIDELVATIRERGVKAVFVESSMSPKLAQTVAAEAGVTVVDADALYTDSLAADGEGSTYLGATIRNTITILEAWGVTPDPLPAELEGL